MKKLTLKRLEKIMIKLVKDNQEHAENIRVKKVDDNYFKVVCDIKYPDHIAEEDHKKWEEGPEYTGWIVTGKQLSSTFFTLIFSACS